MAKNKWPWQVWFKNERNQRVVESFRKEADARAFAARLSERAHWTLTYSAR